MDLYNKIVTGSGIDKTGDFPWVQRRKDNPKGFYLLRGYYGKHANSYANSRWLCMLNLSIFNSEWKLSLPPSAPCNLYLKLYK